MRPKFVGRAPVLRAACAVGVMFSAWTAAAQDADVARPPEPAKKPVVIGVKAGIDGVYKLGRWTPVRIDVLAGPNSEAADLVLQTADSDDVACSYPPISLQLNAGRTTTVTGYVRFGSADPSLNIMVRTPTDGIVNETFTTDRFDGRPHMGYPLNAGDRVVVCVGRSSTLRQMADAFGRNNQQQQKLVVAEVSSPLQLPTRASGYDAVDAVLISADQLDRYAALTPDSAQAGALREYLESGGRVFVVCGRDAPTLLGPGGPLSTICGLKTDAPVPLPRAGARGLRRRQ
ncbi:MAG: hypothetical protein QM775_12005 [Pirellulales bacterium]